MQQKLLILTSLYAWVSVDTITLDPYTPIVSTQQGKLRGTRNFLGQHRYYSIPYAVAERFQFPKDPPNWEGVYDAINPLKSCPQIFFNFKIGHEDCLVLDVYTPGTLTTLQRLPVMVFIHGGAFYYGGKTLYNPEFLVAKNVIVVIINYRLGVHGFLCINGVSNIGLRDQVAALQWVQKNIAAFGGDPDNVTLGGQSAGAASASMHMLSRESKGLFHKVILLSGHALTPWAFNLEAFTPALEDARNIAQACNEKDIYKVFLTASFNDLIEATKGTSDNPRYFKYSPCVDTNSRQPFFHDKPYNILKSGDFNKVPTMIGYTDSEGMTSYGLIEEDATEQFDKHFVDRISSVFSWCSDQDRRKIANIIRSHYFGGDAITLKSVRGLIEYFSDWVVHGTVFAYSRLLTRLSDRPVYNFEFSYMGQRNYVKTFTGLITPGAAHGDELFYIFKPAGLQLWLSKTDRLVINRITTMITNFMKFGNPTPATTKLLSTIWPAATSNATNTLKLDESLSIIESPRDNFFENILCTYATTMGAFLCQSCQNNVSWNWVVKEYVQRYPVLLHLEPANVGADIAADKVLIQNFSQVIKLLLDRPQH